MVKITSYWPSRAKRNIRELQKTGLLPMGIVGVIIVGDMSSDVFC
jgi:hypothetical protein